MLVYSKERFYPTAINTIILEGSDGGFWYIGRAVYDAALMLSVKQNLGGIYQLIDSDTNSKAITFWVENAPEPLTILGPYFGLVTEELPEDIEVLGGVMHVITSQINAYNFIRQKKEIRQTVQFSLAVTKEYQLEWESFKIVCAKDYVPQVLMNFPMFGNGKILEYAPEIYTKQPYDDPRVITESHAEIPLDLKEGQKVVLEYEDLVNDPEWLNLGGGLFLRQATGEMLAVNDPNSDPAKELERCMEEAEREVEVYMEDPDADIKSQVAATKEASGVMSAKERLMAQIASKKR